MSSAILYAEVPGFYAEVERAAQPTLADRPVIVGGDPRKRGLVQAATADAVAAGVAEAMPVLEALERCPRARALRTDMPRYRDFDKRLRAACGQLTERVEPAGLGAAYLDVSAGPDPPRVAAAWLRDQVAADLRLPIRVGGGPVKFVAKLAAEEAGDVGVRMVAPGEVAAFLAPLPVSRLPGVGPNSAARLEELGAHRAGDVLRLGRAVMEQALGNHGLAILASALGQGSDRIRAARHPQTLSQELTLPTDELDQGVLVDHLRQVADRLERALTLEGLVARRLLLKVRYSDGERATRTSTLQRGVRTAADLLAAGEALLARTHAGTRRIRLVGLAATLLRRAPRDEPQLSLFPPKS